MKKRNQGSLYAAITLLTAFVLWTLFVCVIDVRAIGPRGSSVGFATLNGYTHNLTGVNMYLYVITDWLGLVPIGVVLGFAVLGLIQWIARKSLWRVDKSLLILGGFYVVVMATYLLFETVVINYRPILIEGVLEVSYPSSTTLLVTCVMPAAWLRWKDRLENRVLRRSVAVLVISFTVFMVVGRLLSGVHWLTDIIGGILLSAGLVILYHFACGRGKDQR